LTTKCSPVGVRPEHTWFGRTDPTSIRGRIYAPFDYWELSGVGSHAHVASPLVSYPCTTPKPCREASARKVEVILPKHLVEVYQRD
jgi:hypothetical protein